MFSATSSSNHEIERRASFADLYQVRQQNLSRLFVPGVYSVGFDLLSDGTPCLIARISPVGGFRVVVQAGKIIRIDEGSNLKPAKPFVDERGLSALIKEGGRIVKVWAPVRIFEGFYQRLL